jgi:hypothetical protein
MSLLNLNSFAQKANLWRTRICSIALLVNVAKTGSDTIYKCMYLVLNVLKTNHLHISVLEATGLGLRPAGFADVHRSNRDTA